MSRTSEGPGLGLEGLTGRQGSTLSESYEEGGGLHGDRWVSVDLCLGSYSLLALTPWVCETPGDCSLTLGWLCHSREQGIATKVSLP